MCKTDSPILNLHICVTTPVSHSHSQWPCRQDNLETVSDCFPQYKALIHTGPPPPFLQGSTSICMAYFQGCSLLAELQVRRTVCLSILKKVCKTAILVPRAISCKEAEFASSKYGGSVRAAVTVAKADGWYWCTDRSALLAL